ncbi:hypothetical protein B0I35DRAFT_411933 [Stachybotrys elegans]|uniref:Ubiquitin-like domain-containing protein n=1 Tax=Stachybotrys elegans TaxID=80388 RepID=A0A8K0SJY1_9HYPO|nr:hypothetical protein B0I35DRAFT_411933 [Stachybotrys elegans]
MGCCVSRSSGPNSPYPGGAPNASARPINPSSPLNSPESTHSSRNPATRRRHRDQGPLDQHIDKPLRRHQWTSRDRRWTRRRLDHERADFFDTRVTGRPEIWQTVHAALQVMWDSAGQDDQDDEGLATAQTILSAAEISLPSGNLVNGVYDSLGNYYQIPEWVVCDPDNLVEEDRLDVKVNASNTGDETAGEDDEDLKKRREDRGKAVVDVREQIAVRARLSENGRDVVVNISKQDTVKTLSHRVAEEARMLDKRIRMAYMGKMLKENASLESQGWQVGHVVNALIFDTNP